MQEPDSPLSLRKKLLFALCTLLLVLVVLEVGLRILWTPPPRFVAERLRDTRLFVRDEVVGWRLRPGQSFDFQWHWGETTRITTNSAGYRDRERGGEREAGRQCVLILGDSHAFGYGVGDADLMSERLRELRPDLDVVNLAVTGYNLAQSRTVLEIDGRGYQPDVVVLAFTQNDVTRQVAAPAGTAPRDPEQGGVKAFLRDHSRLYAFVRTRVNANKGLARLLVKLGLKDRLGGYDHLDPNLRPFLRAYPASLERDWDETKAELRRMKAIAGDMGARFLLLVVPARETVQPSLLPVALSELEYSPEDFDLDRSYRELAEFCGAEEIPCLDPTPRFREASAAGRSPYFEHDMHIDADGHGILADVLASALETDR